MALHTVQDVLTRALQNIGVVGSGSAPSTADNALALDGLKSLYQSYINAGMFDELVDVIPSDANYTAGENERILNDGTITVTLPTTITQPGYCGLDYSCDYTYSLPQTRPPRDVSVIEVVNTSTGAVNTYLYDNRLRSWTDINSLLASSTVCPLAQRDFVGLAAALSMQIADTFGPSMQPGQLTVSQARNFRSQLATNWSQAGTLIKPGDFD